ncbi:MAG: hypothetical protein IPJ35_10960 [Elusimicrobia bacterium]|nr:hypothetical protein [Elusimicrobiota bacterium]
MNKRSLGFLVLAFAVAPVRAEAPLPSAWSHGADLKASPKGYAAVRLPAAALDRASTDLRDVRVFDAEGVEQPFVIHQPARSAARWANVESLDARLESGATVLAGRAPDAAVDALRLESPEGEFLKSVSLEVREDGVWKTLWKSRPIFRARSGAENRELPFPARRLGEFRVRVDDRGGAPVPFTGAALRLAGDSVPDTESVAAVVAAREERPFETRLTLALPARNLFIDGLTVVTPEAFFQRRVRVVARRWAGVETPGGRQIVEEILGETTLYRTEANGARAEALFVPVNRRLDVREIMLVVTNIDAPPLGLTSVAARVVPTELRFSSDGRPLRLAVGHPGAPAPRYDWPAVDTAPSAAVLGPLVANPDHQAPEVAPLLDGPAAPFDGGGWRHRAPVEIKTLGVQKVEVPLSALVHGASDGRDLRLVRDGRQIPFVYDRSGRYHDVALELVAAKNAPEKTSRWEIRLPFEGMPITHIELNAAETLFQRPLRVIENRTTPNGQPWAMTLAQTPWRRAGGTERLVLTLVEAPRGDTLVLEIDNGDNAPLTVRSFKAHYRSYELVFKSSPGALWLYYGRPEASFPVYDAAMVADELLAAQKDAVPVGPEEKLKRRWGLGRGATGPLFWVVLILVTAALLFAVQRLLPESQGDSGGDRGR